MKKVFVGLMLVSSFAGAQSQLEKAIDQVKNDVDIEQVATAIVCAETGQRCHQSTITGGADLKILKTAMLATNVYGAEDLERIGNAIRVLEPRVQERQKRLRAPLYN